MKFTAHIALLAAGTIVVLSAALLLPWTATAQTQNQYPAVAMSSSDVANGDVILLEIDTGPLKLPASDMRIVFNKRTYRVYKHPAKDNGVYFALLGVPYRTEKGPHILVLNYSDSNGKQTRQIPFKVVAGDYKTDVLEVDSRRVNPNKEDSQRAARERRELEHVYASGSLKRLWNGPFQLPVENEISSRYGNRRVFNGQLKSYHNGLDFRSPTGTPVYATNSGIVRMAKDLFYSGNAVIIDHGTEVFSIYAHLSKIKTAAGRRVEKGQLIGLSGATGRVSGPHLHWGVKLSGTAVNPLNFIEVMNAMVQP
jgi:murein DD-endopeptidase MepM/ murein hydrolase activator NlpD